MLVGGLRVLGTSTGGAAHGVITRWPGKLSNDFFMHLLDMGTQWTRTAGPSAGSHARGRSELRHVGTWTGQGP